MLTQRVHKTMRVTARNRLNTVLNLLKATDPLLLNVEVCYERYVAQYIWPNDCTKKIQCTVMIYDYELIL